MTTFVTRWAMWWVRRQLKKDKGMALAWHCAVACSAQDEGLAWLPAQRAASRFMFMLANISTDLLPEIADGIKKHKEKT